MGIKSTAFGGVSKAEMDAAIAAAIAGIDYRTTEIAAGLEAARPAGSATENIYWATDTKKLWCFDGAAWQDCKAVEMFECPLDADGTDLFAASDGEVEQGYTTIFVKHKEIEYVSGAESELKISFDLKTSLGDENALAQVYKNGSPVGTEQSTYSTSYVEFSETLSFAPGDKIQLYLKTTASFISLARNFRVVGRRGTIAVIDDVQYILTPTSGKAAEAFEVLM